VNVVLLRTEGYGLTAEISVDGSPLTVVDGISRVDAPAAPGPVADPRFDVVFVAPERWQRAVAANPARERRLEHRWGWRYLGFGRVVSLDPVRLDLGVLELELALPPDDARRIGDHVAIAIDRIRLGCAASRGAAAPG
jgi:hypothetical protein